MMISANPNDDVAIDIVESSDGTKFFIPHVDDDIKPKLHGKFKSLKEAEAMYREYADKSGFDNRQMQYTDYKHVLNSSSYKLNAIFWVDEVARRNYQEFGDVISFDGTFRTNLHCMIFVPFLAVDNHKSSVVVGSALINDQCAAMRQAIPSVFTESKHRLCMWHIMNKVPGKVSVALKHNPEFNRNMCLLVCDVNKGSHVYDIYTVSIIRFPYHFT
ncbi:hypothetical protein L6452_17662 [Arctium lappa]|uniref:Uncharacterized protein n=1 Tax=Arctium lappa TaxID=4217 RepID=A0ACB9C3W1_ARCLA|nr:hypothetical protein L6452_17662 [Arctium lappa]